MQVTVEQRRRATADCLDREGAEAHDVVAKVAEVRVEFDAVFLIELWFAVGHGHTVENAGDAIERTR